MKHDVLEDLNLSAYRRIMIIGAPGSGKSRAARRLASITGLPLIHLLSLIHISEPTRP